MDELNLMLPTLPDLAARIDAAVVEAEEHARSAVDAAVRAGRLLSEAKEQLPHGQWEQWIISNCAVAPRTAQAYMRLAARLAELPKEEAQRVADLPLRAAITAIATAPVAPPSYPSASPYSGYRNRPALALTAARGSLVALTRDIGFKPIKHERIKSLQKKLLEAVTELDSMLAASKP